MNITSSFKTLQDTRLTLPAASQATGSIDLPGSKSISNRVLLLAALACGTTVVRGLLKSDDTAVMLQALETLGLTILDLGDGKFQIAGHGGQFPVHKAALFLGNAGTAIRPLTAALALIASQADMPDADFTLSGVPRMHERPIGDLVEALQSLGAGVEYTGNIGFPPLRITRKGAITADEVSVRGDVSSQFLTAMLMSLPLLGRAITVHVQGELISKPYIAITLNLMARFGVVVRNDNFARFHIPARTQYISPGAIFVEGDASSASYFLALGAIAGGPMRVNGAGATSIQGDIAFADALEKMGATITRGAEFLEANNPLKTKLRAIDADFNHIPDAAMTIAICALFADGTSTLRNIASWRVKETDRIAAMATELRKVGAIVEEGADYIRIAPPEKLTPNAVIHTYDDHRMAMCFSLISLGGVPVTILDPNCVAKTFPTYFSVFRRVVS